MTNPGRDPELCLKPALLPSVCCRPMPARKSVARALNLGRSCLPPPSAAPASFSLTQEKTLFNVACSCSAVACARAAVACSHCQQGKSPLGAGWKETSMRHLPLHPLRLLSRSLAVPGAAGAPGLPWVSRASAEPGVFSRLAPAPQGAGNALSCQGDSRGQGPRPGAGLSLGLAPSLPSACSEDVRTTR